MTFLPYSLNCEFGSQVTVARRNVQNQGKMLQGRNVFREKCPTILKSISVQVGAIEGALYMKTKKLISLSVQEAIDCDTIVSPPPALREWTVWIDTIYTLGGIESDETYPYLDDKKHRCHRNKSRNVAYLDNGYFIFGKHVVAEKITKKGPMANFMNINPRTFQFYSEGNCTMLQKISKCEA